MLLLEQNTIRKGQVDKAIFQLEFKDGNSDDKEECEVEAIWNNIVYAKKSEGHLPGLY